MAQASEAQDYGRVAVVTGGGGGMGFACARRLAQRMPVIAADESEAALEQSLAKLSAAGLDVTGVVCDITDAAAVGRLTAAVSARGELGALVHTAGISPSMVSSPRRVLEVDLIGTAIILDSFLPHTTVGSAAVCIASISGYRRVPAAVDPLLLDSRSDDFFERIEQITPLGDKTRLAYALAKRGVKLLCEYHARAWGQRGARLCSISPGGTLTRMVQFEKGRGGRGLVEQTALGRRGSPHEIASVANFLCSPEASYITGCDVPVEGGVMAGYLHHATPEVRETWREALAD